jgi:hypothetical protein
VDRLDISKDYNGAQNLLNVAKENN